MEPEELHKIYTLIWVWSQPTVVNLTEAEHEHRSAWNSGMLSTLLKSLAVSIRPHLLLPCGWNHVKTRWDKEGQWAKDEWQFRSQKFSKLCKYHSKEQFEWQEVYKKRLQRSKLSHCLIISMKTKTSRHLVPWSQEGPGTSGQSRVEGPCPSSGPDTLAGILPTTS